jgi:hypothetical protein
MSMSQDNQDFGSLCRLLALKRHEQPPPGYFNDFSSQVIARIRSGEGANEHPLERLFWEAPWLQRLWAALESKPVLAGAFGVAVCALLVGGVLYSEKTDVQPIGSGPVATTASPVQIANVSALDQTVFVQPGSSAFSDATATPDSGAAASAAAGIFGLLPKPTAQAASANLSTLTLSGGN